VLGPAEEAEYLALGARLAARIERSLHPAVVANRASLAEAARGRLRLEPLGAARARWRGEVHRLLAERPGAVVTVDVRDCYGSIRGEVVEESLLRAGCHRGAVGALGRLLQRWESTGSAGLPVGPLPSAVLANAVLAPVDHQIAAAGWRHVRWVDDVVVTAHDRSTAGEILERLRACLARLGLRLAEEKCVAVDADDPSLGDTAGRSGFPPAFRRPAGNGDAHADAGPARLAKAARLSDAARLADLADPAPERELEVLRALRRLAPLPLGAPEADILRTVATDPARHELVRAWAWRALARTDRRTVLDRAADWQDDIGPVLGRAVAVAAAIACGPAARAFLRHHGRTSDGAATAAWGLAR
jgi:hypothetical protein